MGPLVLVVLPLPLSAMQSPAGEVPPAATKITIDYVLTDRPLPDDLPSWLPVPDTRIGLRGWSIL